MIHRLPNRLVLGEQFLRCDKFPPIMIGLDRDVGREICPLGNPLGEISDNRAGQLLLGRHFPFILMPHCDDHQAFIRFADDNGWPLGAALEDGLTRVELEFALYFPCTLGVALVALCRQHGANFFLEEIYLCLGRLTLSPNFRLAKRQCNKK